MIKKLSLLVSLVLLPVATLSAKTKEKPDFSEFKGNYTGTTLLNASAGITISTSGPVSIQVTVPRNGRSAVATVSGSLTISSTLLPFSGTLTMTKSALTGSDALFNLYTTAPFTVPGKLSRNGFKANGSSFVSSPPVTVLIQSSVKVKPRGKKKKKITITYVISAPGAFYSFQFTATGKVRTN